MDEQSIGITIRQHRTTAGITLTALAKKAELTKSSLSKIETGQIAAPISTFVRIADALGVRLADFFTESEKDPAYVVTRKGEGSIITRDGSKFGYAYEALALEFRNKSFEPFVLTTQPGDKGGVFRHGGQEFILVLSGRMAFTIGDETLRLGPGDSIFFDPRLEHCGVVVGTTPVRMLAIFTQDDAASLKRKRKP